jgi:hypothetical protein
MKKILKLITVVLFAGTFLNSCETTELDLRVSPNDLADNQADPNLLLNSIQLAYVSNINGFQNIGGQVTRIEYMSGRNYFNRYPGDTFNGIWSRTYSSGTNLTGSSAANVGIWTNLATLEAIDAASDIDYSFHIAVGKTLKAHMLMLLVDYLGETAFSQAGNPDEFPAPTLDNGQEVYAAAIALLDEAAALFATNPQTNDVSDFFYGGNSVQWLKAANSLKLKAHITTGNVAAFNAIIASGNFIATNADDFQFQYGSRQLQPDTRHPRYAADYQITGAGNYKSNWLMETMLVKNDPRIRYYFYRQTDATPGALDINGDPADPNEERLACSLEVPPAHFVDGGFTYCSVDAGYWGRSHGNDQGTPPDNFFRTAVGVYPAAGRFDDNSFGQVGLGLGGGGAGIEPILLASHIDFWRAEIAGSAAAAAPFFRSALEKSIAKVQSFGSVDGTANPSFAPSALDVTTFIDGQISAYLAASGDAQANILAEQYFITLYGGATEAYNYYRRTGYPTTLTPNWELNPGPFPRTFLYPQNEVITNPNLTQKLDNTQQVFWDTNPASPVFPPAN